MWAYYEGFDNRYEIDGDPEAYRLMKFAMAILIADPGKIIYLPIRDQAVGGESRGAVLCRPELQLSRSEWVRLRRQLNQAHRIEKYILRYEPDKLCGIWENMEGSPAYYTSQDCEKQEVNELRDDTVFMVLLKESCLRYHWWIVDQMRKGVPQYPSVPVGGLGWLLSSRAIQEMKEDAKAKSD